MNLKQIWDLTAKSVEMWVDDYAPSMGAALAYYTLFSMAPLLIIVIAVAGLVLARTRPVAKSSRKYRGSLARKAPSPCRAAEKCQ